MLRPARILLPLAALATLVLVLPGCGSSSTPRASAAERQAYIAKGDAICAAYNTLARRLRGQLAERRAEAVAAQSLKPYTRPLNIAREGAHEAVKRFKALPAPAGDEQRIGQLTAVMDEQTQLLDKLTNATAANDTTTFKPLNDRLIAVGQDEQRLARAYGFRECGSRS